MLRWITRLFIGHNHRWKIISEREAVCCYGKGVRYYLQCEICGTVKVKNPWA